MNPGSVSRDSPTHSGALCKPRDERGMLTADSGDWDHGCAMAERAMHINPRHPEWYWFPIFYNAYRKGEYREALSHALKINMPGFYHAHMVLAATDGQLGEREAASKALR